MGGHKEWRKTAKKLRRKRIRSLKAEERDECERIERERRESSPTYIAWSTEQKALEVFEQQEEQRLAEELQRQWELKEANDQRRWREQQVQLEKARAEKVKQELLIREEWEREQKKLREEKEKKEKEAEEKRKTQEELLAQIDAFISGKVDLPPSIESSETQPGQPVCPFFAKTGACRFRNRCSRNHFKPGISRILLFSNFYDSFVMNTGSNSMNNEYDTDVGLEFEDSDTYHHFLEFYNDILPEFELCGRLRQLKVCCNYEAHLRGNVYVEYFSKRHALKAYQMFQGRYYGGRQLSVSFTNIPLWKNALCGLFHKQRCPKGRTCNFLHTFRNPFNAFSDADSDSLWRTRESPSHRKRMRSPKNWRWLDSSEESAEELLEPRRDSCREDEKKRRVRSRERDSLFENRKESNSRKQKRRRRSRSRSWSDVEQNNRSSKRYERRRSKNRDKHKNGKSKENKHSKVSGTNSESSHKRTKKAAIVQSKNSEKGERTP